MSVLKIPIILFLLAMKLSLTAGQWNNCGNYPNQGFSAAPTYKIPVKFVPAQPIACQVNSCPGPELIPQNVPYPPYAPYPPYPYNYPGDITIPPSSPGQPVIVINNGGSDGPGGSDNGFDIGELLTLLLAFNGGGGLLGGHGHHGHGHGPPKQEAPKEEPDEPSGMFPPWYGYPGFYPGMNGCYPPGYPYYPGYFPGSDDDDDAPEWFTPIRECSKKSGDSINITIVLPNSSSGSTNVEVDTKDNNKDKKKCKVYKDECKED